jgi:hypothetical protein
MLIIILANHEKNIIKIYVNRILKILTLCGIIVVGVFFCKVMNLNKENRDMHMLSNKKTSTRFSSLSVIFFWRTTVQN